MRIYFSGNTGIYPPEVLLAKRPAHIMLSFYFLSKRNPRKEDKGTRKRFRQLMRVL